MIRLSGLDISYNYHLAALFRPINHLNILSFTSKLIPTIAWSYIAYRNINFLHM